MINQYDAQKMRDHAAAFDAEVQQQRRQMLDSIPMAKPARTQPEEVLQGEDQGTVTPPTGSTATVLNTAATPTSTTPTTTPDDDDATPLYQMSRQELQAELAKLKDPDVRADLGQIETRQRGETIQRLLRDLPEQDAVSCDDPEPDVPLDDDLVPPAEEAASEEPPPPPEEEEEFDV